MFPLFVQPKKLLVTAAHPDDEILGCGGTIARLIEEGNKVFVVILGEGETSRYSHPDNTPRELINHLRQAAMEIKKDLGIQEVFFLELPDNRFDTLPILEIIKKIEKIVNMIQPGVVFTHHAGDLNIDHAITNRAVITATRPTPENRVESVLCFEIASSTEWALKQTGSVFQPNIFIDISKTFRTKIKALDHYRTEMREFPHPRSLKAIEACALRLGSMAGVPLAEGFELVRSVFPSSQISK